MNLTFDSNFRLVWQLVTSMIPWYILMDPGFSTIHKPRTDIRRSWCLETARFLNHSQAPNWYWKKFDVEAAVLWIPRRLRSATWWDLVPLIGFILESLHTASIFEVFHLVLPEIKMTLLEHINNILKIHPNLVKFIWFYDNDLSNLEYLVGCLLNFIFIWLFVINTIIIWKYVISNTVELRK